MVTQVRAASQHSLVASPGEVSSLEEVITSDEELASEVTWGHRVRMVDRGRQIKLVYVEATLIILVWSHNHKFIRTRKRT